MAAAHQLHDIGRLYYTPRGILAGPAGCEIAAGGEAWPFLGDRGAFAHLELTTRREKSVTRRFLPRTGNDRSCDSAMPAVLDNLTHARPAFAGLDMSKPRIMGIVNVTPDSFSDGGVFASADAAIVRGLALREAGADIIDVGGESTRPGATPVDPEEEARRVLPVIKALVARGATVSVDTRHVQVMAAAIDSGASIINDVTALADPAVMSLIARSEVAVVLMHMQGEPRTMQDNPIYNWAPGDVFDVLADRVEACVKAGIGRARIAVDPGLGFGKTARHSTEILNHIAMFHGLGCVVAVGASRKRFIASLSRNEAADGRLAGSLAAALYAVGEGVQIVRVHDVAETRQALAVAGKLAGHTD